MGGWTGGLLRVDLTARTAQRETLSRDILENYLGGRGLGAYLLCTEGRHQLDPFDPAAPLLLAAGPLTGTRAPTGSRTSLTALSPLTNTLFDSNSGGMAGIALRRAGFDALWIEGASDGPVVLVVDGGEVSFEPAGALWGQGTRATRAGLDAWLGKGFATLTIGVAGETGSLLANVAHGGRFFGRGGLGALFGHKGLKAVCIRGDGALDVADPEGFAFVVNECRKWINAHPITSKGLPQFGTPVLMNVMDCAGVLPADNFRKAGYAGAGRISGEAIRDTLMVGRHGCPGCPITCGRKVKVGDEELEGPEFETLWSFGADLGIDDLAGIASLNALTNDLGMDTISAGSTIAAARELFERGTLGWDPLAGGVEGVAGLLREMATATGDGALLRHGSRRLGEEVGAPEVSMTAKGLEFPAYDPRGCQGQGLAYATSNRGGCHLRAYMIAPELLATPKRVDRFASGGKAGLVIVGQNLNAAVDSLVLCRFTSFALKDDYYARLLRAAAGMEVDGQGLMTIGERIYTLERLANLARGLGRADDCLPARLTREPVDDGPTEGRTVELEPMLAEYYRFRGWDSDGVPAAEKLERLGLDGLDIGPRPEGA